MRHYLCQGQESGEVIIIHGDKAMREYCRDAERGEAEWLEEGQGLAPTPIDLRRHRTLHARLCGQGMCYGPCGIGDAKGLRR